MSNNYPIFDSLLHPTIDQRWIDSRELINASVKSVIAAMLKNNISKGLAVGLRGVGGYDEKEYVNFVRASSDALVPIAFFDVLAHRSTREIHSKLVYLKALGYKGVKLHPRIGTFNLDHPSLPSIVKQANDLDLAVLFCTYFYSNFTSSFRNNTDLFVSFMEKIPMEKIILMHGGGIHLMQYAELARHFPNSLLDLSFTMLKYAGSSLDLDLKYLFEKFDRRICIGSDSPEFDLSELRLRFEALSGNCSEDKKKNIAYKNLENFIFH